MIGRLSHWLVKHSLLILICILAFSVRLYRIEYPLLDWHSWRQADTASVSYRYVQDGIDLLHPKYQDISNIASGKDNPQGYRMVEFPFINALVAAIVILIPQSDLVVVSRLVSITFSIGTLICIYWLVLNISGKKTAFWASLVYALLPYAVFYGRSALPEPGMVFFSLLAVVSWYFWLKYKQLGWFVTTTVALAMALLLKPFAVFFIPVLLGISVARYHKSVWRNYSLAIVTLLAMIPMIWWRNWITQYPEGIPASNWLFNGFVAANDSLIARTIGYSAEGTRYHLFWIRWIVYERFIKLFLGFAGIVFLPVAMYKLISKELWIYGTWWLGVCAYLVVIAHGNVQHDYYQQLIIPILAITVGRGIVILDQLLSLRIKGFYPGLVIFSLLIVSWALSWWQIRGFYNINNWSYVKAGQAVQRLTKPEDLVIAADPVGDSAFLFQTGRNGWPLGLDIEKKQEMGAHYYVSTRTDDVTKYLESKYFTVEKTSEFIIIDLTRQRTE